MNVTFFGVFIAGVLMFFSPCILPLIPLYVSYVTGNFDEEKIDVKRNLLAATGFSLGLMAVFTMFGMTATALSHFLLRFEDTFRIISGLIVIVFGFFHMGVIKIGFLSSDKRIGTFGRKNHIFADAFLLGLAFSFGWTPCIGTVLGSILFIVANNLTIAKGILYMVVFSLGFSIPFIIASVTLNAFIAKLTNSRVLIYLKYLTGIIIIAMGVLLLLDKVGYLLAL